MKNRTLKSLALGLVLFGSTAVPRSNVSAQQPSQAGGGTVSINNQAGRVQIKLERGSKVAVSNRYGRITITGWDRDTVEATATGPKGPEAVQVEMTADPQATSRLTLAVASRARQPQPGVYTPVPVAPGTTMTAEQIRELREAAVAQTKEAVKLIEKNAKDVEKAMQDAAKGQAKGTTATPEGGAIIVQPPTVTVPAQPGAPAAPPAQAARPGQPTPRPAPAPRAGTHVLRGATASRAEEIHLDVKVPRFAQLDTIEVRAGDLTVTNIDGPVSVSGGSSNVTASNVGALTVRTRGGDVNVDGVNGMVYVVAHSGDITVRNAASEVRAMTNNGNINIACARGRVDASTAYGKIALANIGGDVDANTTNSEISYTGPISDGSRYRLKSMEGRVVMSIPENSPGFTANLMSYSREATSDFAVRNASATGAGGPAPAPRRVESHHGNGRAFITLDSFGQTVRLAKLAPSTAAVTCR
ncbi:MAG TPA: DUF4097 family beta strand repeat-containing protein [Pyrinomonadaceae bacterium]|nr:DUF4097 family beta strand repeat-containing protein [Pyrinomonadaceae bacterium]